MDGVLKSKQFDDVYFSAEDGLAETRHVFLEGNGLPQVWPGRDEFVIFETGFGTGLNFLAVWELFQRVAVTGQRLHFISVEKYPLARNDIRDALERWEFGEQLDMMLAHYPFSSFRGLTTESMDPAIKSRDDGWVERDVAYNFDFGNVKLTLHIGDVNEIMPGLDYAVDCWFLDGFKPSSNPEMWSDVVFDGMARMSAPGASFATFTAAGDVRRGLLARGFEVRKVPGFGRKREMLVGVKG